MVLISFASGNEREQVRELIFSALVFSFIDFYSKLTTSAVDDDWRMGELLLETSLEVSKLKSKKEKEKIHWKTHSFAFISSCFLVNGRERVREREKKYVSCKCLSVDVERGTKEDEKQKPVTIRD